MTTNTENNTRVERYSACTGKRGGIFCGLMLVVIGTIWIGKQTGIIPLDMHLFWPAVMVAVGTWIFASAMLKKRR